MAAKSETAVRTTGAVGRIAATGTAPTSARNQAARTTAPGRRAASGKVAASARAAARMRAAAEAARRAVADTARAVSEEVRESFRAWVERNFLNARAGRIGGVSYARAGELDDAVPESGPRGARREARRLWYAEAYDRALVDHMEPLRAEEADFLLRNPLVALQLALGVTDLRGLRCLRRGLTQEVNRLQARACRARRYARENARRRALAAERRRIARRTTQNPRPTPEALCAAFAARGASPEAKVRLGGLLEDLECHVDNCLRFGPDGEILGRNGGVKAWLREHAPELFGRYKTLMRYKALARRLRQAAGIADPVPASAVFDGPPAPLRAPSRLPAPQSGRRDALGADCEDASGAGGGDVSAGRAERGRGDARDYYALESHLAAARRLVEGCGNTCAALFRAVDAALEGEIAREGEAARAREAARIGEEGGGRHPMAGAEQAKRGRAAERPSLRRAPRRARSDVPRRGRRRGAL